MIRSTVVAAGVLCLGMWSGSMAGPGCCPSHGKKASLDKIEVKEEYKTKEAKLEAYKKKYADVTHEELLAAIESGDALIIDVNGKKSYEKAHVTGAVGFHDKKALKAALPKDKDALVIPYCGSPKCAAWTDAADYVAKLGYTNIKHYSDGIKGWLAKQSGEEANKRES